MRSTSGINQSDHVDRARRVGEFVQREITDLIKNEFDDPRFNLVTVTDVRLTRDLRHATVFVSRAEFISKLNARSESDENRKSDGKSAQRAKSVSLKKAALEGGGKRASKSPQPDYVVALNRASARIRHLLAQRMTTKSTPRLQFEFDEVLEQGHRVSSILDTTALEAREPDDQVSLSEVSNLPESGPGQAT